MLQIASMSFLPRVPPTRCAELGTLYKNMHLTRTLRPKSLRDFEASLCSLSISFNFIATINSMGMGD